MFSIDSNIKPIWYILIYVTLFYYIVKKDGARVSLRSILFLSITNFSLSIKPTIPLVFFSFQWYISFFNYPYFGIHNWVRNVWLIIPLLLIQQTKNILILKNVRNDQTDSLQIYLFEINKFGRLGRVYHCGLRQCSPIA